jgi:hypothetical protein
MDDPYAPRPMWYFFYVTLKDPSRLASVAGLEELPDAIDAKVHHVKPQYWVHTQFLYLARLVLLLKGGPACSQC